MISRTSPLPSFKFFVCDENDTPAAVAMAHGLTTSALVLANRPRWGSALSDHSRLRYGTELNLPGVPSLHDALARQRRFVHRFARKLARNPSKDVSQIIPFGLVAERVRKRVLLVDSLEGEHTSPAVSRPARRKSGRDHKCNGLATSAAANVDLSRGDGRHLLVRTRSSRVLTPFWRPGLAVVVPFDRGDEDWYSGVVVRVDSSARTADVRFDKGGEVWTIPFRRVLQPVAVPS